MAEVFLVVLRRAETVRALLSAAAGLIAGYGTAGEGRINALAVRLPPAATIIGTEEVLTPQIDEMITAREQERITALRVAFDAWAAQSPHGVTLAWHDEEDDAEALVGRLGAAAEIIVLDLPQQGESDAEAGARHAALFTAARPVLLVPANWQGSTLGRHVAIAWQDDPHAVAAVRAAMPLLRRAERISLLREGDEAATLPAVLSEHRITAELCAPLAPDGPAGAALLRAAREKGADLLVMGGFGHSRLREFLLGGMTRYMLQHAHLPVLLRH